MPNWCSNRALITGPTEVIDQLVQRFLNKDLLEYLSPEPDYSVTPVADTFPDLAGAFVDDPEEKARRVAEAATPRIRPYGRASWDWRVQNWGTKWDVEGDVLEYERHGDGTATATLDFDSAWSAPTGAYKTGEERLGIKIEAYYLEMGVGFYGVYEDGADDAKDLPDAYEDLLELPQPILELADHFYWLNPEYKEDEDGDDADNAGVDDGGAAGVPPETLGA